MIYASYDACNIDSNNNGDIDGRLAAKLASASKVLLREVGIPNTTQEERREISKNVAEYIRDNKPELLEAYNNSPDSTETEQANCLFQKID